MTNYALSNIAVGGLEQVSVFLLRGIPEWVTNNSLFEIPYWLVDADKERYLGMRSYKRRSEFLAGRLVLRYGLKHKYGQVANDWRLIALPDSAPYLEGRGGNDFSPTISIAHSAGLVVCAVAALPRLGVDVENYQKRNIDLMGVATSTLHSYELDEMQCLTTEKQKHYFFSRWTLKEALAKALGIGLSLPFRKFAFADCKLFVSPDDWDARKQSWCFKSLTAGVNASIGLAWVSDIKEAKISVNLHDVKSEQLFKFFMEDFFGRHG